MVYNSIHIGALALIGSIPEKPRNLPPVHLHLLATGFYPLGPASERIERSAKGKFDLVRQIKALFRRPSVNSRRERRGHEEVLAENLVFISVRAPIGLTS